MSSGVTNCPFCNAHGTVSISTLDEELGKWRWIRDTERTQCSSCGRWMWMDKNGVLRPAPSPVTGEPAETAIAAKVKTPHVVKQNRHRDRIEKEYENRLSKRRQKAQRMKKHQSRFAS